MKRIVAFAYLGLISLTPFSCNDFPDCGTKAYEVTVEEIALRFGSYNGGSFFEYAELAIPMNHGVLAVILEVAESTLVQVAESTSSFSFSGISEAVACTPNPPEVQNRMTSFKVYAEDTIYSSGNSFEPGIDLSALFYIPSRKCDYDFQCHLGVQIFENPNEWPTRFADWGDQILFQLITAPDSAINSILYFEIGMDDGKKFDLSIGPILVDG
ncbi:MAG: hypothetical protein AAGC88_02120 [Bacteroidota bacterium]